MYVCMYVISLEREEEERKREREREKNLRITNHRRSHEPEHRRVRFRRPFSPQNPKRGLGLLAPFFRRRRQGFPPRRRNKKKRINILPNALPERTDFPRRKPRRALAVKRLHDAAVGEQADDDLEGVR